MIAIIGVIMSIGAANLITAQKQARDASRRSIIHNIQTAFEQFYVQNSAYPNQTANNIGAAFDNSDSPQDPKNSGIYVIDYSKTSSSAYCVCAKLEVGIGNADDPNSTSCSWNSEGTSYCAQNKQ